MSENGKLKTWAEILVIPICAVTISGLFALFVADMEGDTGELDRTAQRAIANINNLANKAIKEMETVALQKMAEADRYAQDKRASADLETRRHTVRDQQLSNFIENFNSLSKLKFPADKDKDRSKRIVAAESLFADPRLGTSLILMLFNYKVNAENYRFISKAERQKAISFQINSLKREQFKSVLAALQNHTPTHKLQEQHGLISKHQHDALVKILERSQNAENLALARENMLFLAFSPKLLSENENSYVILDHSCDWLEVLVGSSPKIDSSVQNDCTQKKG